ncbi:protein GET1 [Blastomyces parvus]|uniref:Protein GET1 n=1 Tax=Blastomyces parvus TaxID=2060905 RepID=A0A2B7X006_9EURO|nr:protein GET1 [Blastomyces parvus]
MPSLLITVLFLNIVIYVINTIGAATINGLLWLLYIKLPTGTSHMAREQRRLKREVIQLKREMNATSSQDEFAKWAKLRRRHDKALEAYEAKNNELTQSKSSFDMTVKSARWVATSGLMLFLQFWYSKKPIFTLPPGWIPWQVQWVLSFPRAPMGTVSIQIWGGACATVVALVGDAVGYVAGSKSQGIKVGAGMGEKEGKKSQ